MIRGMERLSYENRRERGCAAPSRWLCCPIPARARLQCGAEPPGVPAPCARQRGERGVGGGSRGGAG